MVHGCARSCRPKAVDAELMGSWQPVTLAQVTSCARPAGSRLARWCSAAGQAVQGLLMFEKLVSNTLRHGRQP